ncbi:putative alpha-L-fucosidase [Phlebotomus argentipes]|uniref:putative alpha-L-fucosidase n=1 Tax=Phlebotomus argentipes TaxID=94469 RepID=UPI0028934DCB|nr:putative alpha-L-fucosidase [Phlebotomus argentipes]
MKPLSVHFVALLAVSVASGVELVTRSGPETEKYQPTWESLDSRPLPSWYDEAKVGIFIHWGVYSVPSFGSEWFWINWKENSEKYVEYMKKNFKPGFSYQDFARDFTAEHFNASEWADLFARSGAKYIVLTSKHHEGYTMWPSKYSFSWNAQDVGPHRDLLGELAHAIRSETKLRFGVYHSLYEWFNPLYLSDKESNFTKQEFVEHKIFPEMLELVDEYQPEVLWSDGEWEASDDYWRSREFLSWLYNDSPVRDSVVTNDRWGKDILCKHGDFFTCQDRYNPGVLQPHKWENAMTIDKKSWGYRVDARLEEYLTTQDLIFELASTVSCGGNLLVNVGPTKEGLIAPIFEERLTELGEWLQSNGEAIYATKPWQYQNDTQTTGVWYTSREDEHWLYVYAIVLKYPRTSNITLYSLGGKFNENSRIILLGYDVEIKWTGTAQFINIEFPPKDELDRENLRYAWTFRINLPK